MSHVAQYCPNTFHPRRDSTNCHKTRFPSTKSQKIRKKKTKTKTKNQRGLKGVLPEAAPEIVFFFFNKMLQEIVTKLRPKKNQILRTRPKEKEKIKKKKKKKTKKKLKKSSPCICSVCPSRALCVTWASLTVRATHGHPTCGCTGVQWVSLLGPTSVSSYAQAGWYRGQSANPPLLLVL